MSPVPSTDSVALRLTEPERHRLERVERLATLLDNAIPIPGTRFRIGLDPLLGLLPGLGDALGALASAWILVEAARLGASRTVLARMLYNIAVDTLIGAVPGAGDFSSSWRTNSPSSRSPKRGRIPVGLKAPRTRLFSS